MINFVFIGAPGSGKGTQANRLIAEHGFKHVSTGDLLRSEVASGSELGVEIKAIIDSGALVSDDVVLRLLESNCDLSEGAFIFDGFPRNLAQCETLDRFCGDFPKKALLFDVDFESLIERIINRRVAPKSGAIYNLITNPPKVEGICDVSGEELVHRKDDKEEVVRKRIQVYALHQAEMVEFYSNKGELVRIDANLSTEEVYEQVLKNI